MGTTTLGPKGQVVIPVEARDKMGIAPGDKLIALYVADKKSIAFISENQAQLIVDQFDDHIGVLRSVITGEGESQ